jgi:hypothetical protein
MGSSAEVDDDRRFVRRELVFAESDNHPRVPSWSAIGGIPAPVARVGSRCRAIHAASAVGNAETHRPCESDLGMGLGSPHANKRGGTCRPS